VLRKRLKVASGYCSDAMSSAFQGALLHQQSTVLRNPCLRRNAGGPVTEAWLESDCGGILCRLESSSGWTFLAFPEPMLEARI
jgi:hypothetical protein